MAGAQRRNGFRVLALLPDRSHLESLREEPEFKRLVSELEQEYAALKIQRLLQVLRAQTARRVVPTKNAVLTELAEFGQPYL